jgi:hypothetical protein
LGIRERLFERDDYGLGHDFIIPMGAGMSSFRLLPDRLSLRFSLRGIDIWLIFRYGGT